MKGIHRFGYSRHSLLLRYLLSFLLVLAIPLTAVSIYFLIGLNHRLEEESYTGQQTDLVRIAGRIDKHFDGIQECRQRLRSSSTMLRYKLRNLQEFGLPVINELRGNCGQDDLLSNIFVFSPEYAYAYSAYTTYTTANFVRHIAGEGQSVEEYAAFALESAAHGRPLYTDTKVYYFYPFEPGGEKAVLIYELDLTRLHEQLLEELTSSSRFLAVYTEQGQLLSSAGMLSPEEVRESLTGCTGGPVPRRLQVNGTELNATGYSSETSGWRYLYLCSASGAAELVRQSNARQAVFFSLVLSVGCFLVFLFTYLSYRPIQMLKDTASGLLPGKLPENIRGKDELEVVRNILSSLHSSVEKLSSLEGVNRRALKQYAVTSTALGLVKDYSTIRLSFDQLGVLEENEYYFSVLLYLSEQSALPRLDGREVMDAYADFLESYPAGELRLCAVNGSEFNQMILLLSAGRDDIQVYFPTLQALRKSFTEQFGVRATLSVGLAYPELDFISLSYMQALTAYEYRAIAEYDCVIVFDPLAAGLGADIKYQNLLGYLQKAMDSANSSDVSATFAYILQMADTQEMTVHNVKFFCYGLLKVLSASLYTYKYDFFSKLSEKYDLSMVMSIETTEEFKRFLQNVAEDTCRLVSEYEAICQERDGEAESYQHTYLSQVAGLIEESLSDSRLSTAFLAEKFGYSVSYFSKLFKETYGVTVYEYINDLRMQRAMELLSTTGDTLESIVAEIGYLDTSSFIRKFKKIAGVTPGDYRRLHKVKEAPHAS